MSNSINLSDDMIRVIADGLRLAWTLRKSKDIKHGDVNFLDAIDLIVDLEASLEGIES